MPEASSPNGPPRKVSAARTRIIWVVLAAGVLPAVVSLAAKVLFGETPRTNDRMHGVLELVGSCIALGVAMLLLMQMKRERGTGHLLWMAAALTAMGLMDAAHAMAPVGIEWSWLRHGATLVGGVLAGLVWLPVPAAWARRGGKFLIGAGVISTGAVLAVWQWAELLPMPWAGAGGYIPLVKAANVVGGLGFVSAAVFFFRRYLRQLEAQDLVFGGHALLFAVAGLLFGFSRVWAADWWVWHGFRLLAFGVVLLAAYRIVLGLYARMARQAAELELAKAGLEVRVAERTGKLRESEEKYRLLFDTMAEGFGLHEIILDADGKPCDWRFLELNAAWEQQTGMTRAEVVGKTMRQVWPDLDACWLERFGKVALSGEPLRSEGYNPHLQSWYEVLAYRTKPNQFAVVFADITERKRAEEALRQAQQRLALAVKAGQSGTFDWDAPTNRNEWSEELLALYGIAPGEFGGRYEDWIECVVPEDREAGAAAVKRSLETGEFAVEFRIRRRDNGEIRWMDGRGKVLFDEAGQPARMLGINMDITERKRAEEALREAEERLRLAVEGVDLGIWDLDLRTNVAMRTLRHDQIFGYKELQPVWTLEIALEHVLPEDREATREAHAAARSTGHLFHESRVRWPDGSVHWISARGRMQYDEQGQPVRIAGVVMDITERKRAEEALQKSEARWNAALESFTEGAIIATESEEVIYWNPAARRLHGFKGPEEGIEPLADTPKTFELRTPDGSHLLGLEEWPMKRIKRGERVQNLELRLRRPDQGWERFVTYSGTMVEAAGERLIFLSVHDLTEQRKAERALRESEEQFRLLYEKAPLGIARIDSNTGRFLLINARYCDILQRTEAEALQLDFQAVTHPDDVAQDLQNMQRLREGLCLSFQMDKRYLRPDGSIVWVNLTVVPEWAEGQPVSAHIAMVADITDRKRAEEALVGSEQLYRAIGESIDYGIWICDAHGRNLYASDSFLKLTGITQEQCSEFGWGDILHPDDTEATIEAWKQCVQSGGPWYREHRYRGADGQWHPILACGVAVRNERGEITRWAGINLDISRLKQTEDDLRKARDELEESNADLERLVAERTAKLQELVGELEHFSYTITHDLKSPLRAMRGFAEVVQQIGVQAEAKPFLERISTSAERMDQLIADALSYGRAVRQELPLEDVDAGALLRGMLDSYPEFQPDKARVRVEGRLPVVLGNEAGLTQCFSNLLGNAVKFVKRGELADIRVWADHRDGWVRIWVEDKGIGIAKEMLPRVFDMFARASKEYEGTGIGLALVRKVAQRMGGRVGVESEEGKGCRFWFELKSGEREALTGATARKVEEPGAAGGTVLYVEDEESDAMFMERAFAGKGLGDRLRLVTDGRAAISYLSGSGEYIDRQKYPVPALVLLDLNLPYVPGFEVLEWMRNHPDFAKTPVVIFSSSTREDDRVRAMELGASEFVSKPSSAAKFGEVVEGLRGRWLRREGG